MASIPPRVCLSAVVPAYAACSFTPDSRLRLPCMQHLELVAIPVHALKRARFLDANGEIPQDGVTIDVEIFNLIFSKS